MIKLYIAIVVIILCSCKSNQIIITESDFSIVVLDTTNTNINLEKIDLVPLKKFFNIKNPCSLERNDPNWKIISIDTFKQSELISTYSESIGMPFNEYKGLSLNNFKVYNCGYTLFKELSFQYILVESPDLLGTGLNRVQFLVAKGSKKVSTIILSSCNNKGSDNKYISATDFENNIFRYQQYLSDKEILYTNYEFLNDGTIVIR